MVFPELLQLLKIGFQRQGFRPEIFCILRQFGSLELIVKLLLHLFRRMGEQQFSRRRHQHILARQRIVIHPERVFRLRMTENVPPLPLQNDQFDFDPVFRRKRTEQRIRLPDQFRPVEIVPADLHHRRSEPVSLPFPDPFHNSQLQHGIHNMKAGRRLNMDKLRQLADPVNLLRFLGDRKQKRKCTLNHLYHTKNSFI